MKVSKGGKVKTKFWENVNSRLVHIFIYFSHFRPKLAVFHIYRQRYSEQFL